MLKNKDVRCRICDKLETINDTIVKIIVVHRFGIIKNNFRGYWLVTAIISLIWIASMHKDDEYRLV